jgi:hypothetical protein
MLLVHEALRYEGMRPEATCVCGLQLLVYFAASICTVVLVKQRNGVSEPPCLVFLCRFRLRAYLRTHINTYLRTRINTCS